MRSGLVFTSTEITSKNLRFSRDEASTARPAAAVRNNRGGGRDSNLNQPPPRMQQQNNNANRTGGNYNGNQQRVGGFNAGRGQQQQQHRAPQASGKCKVLFCGIRHAKYCTLISYFLD